MTGPTKLQKTLKPSLFGCLFQCLRVPRKRVASFEKRVKKIDGKDGYIDLLWKGILLVEQKSTRQKFGPRLSAGQGLFPRHPGPGPARYILVSDFARFRLYDLEEDTEHEFTLENLYKNVRLRLRRRVSNTSYKEQEPGQHQSRRTHGKLHDKLKAIVTRP